MYGFLKNALTGQSKKILKQNTKQEAKRRKQMVHSRKTKREKLIARNLVAPMEHQMKRKSTVQDKIEDCWKVVMDYLNVEDQLSLASSNVYIGEMFKRYRPSIVGGAENRNGREDLYILKKLKALDDTLGT
ncbi:uncharacterized protein LOC108164031 [Drosophila miranda]|uniref:uncharacterized protein LOC108164031 n=1 Tax=Drosophila miranda TaxID=7229 RepID=UPI0007E61738|nr:uncharacterized protein LOC108164031 [Drosophila miranda]XP_033249541.1 uncharacterized protein LOC108164031 [Drosophila miranda]